VAAAAQVCEQAVAHGYAHCHGRTLMLRESMTASPISYACAVWLRLAVREQAPMPRHGVCLMSVETGVAGRAPLLQWCGCTLPQWASDPAVPPCPSHVSATVTVRLS
jgi:hypothetical protein